MINLPVHIIFFGLALLCLIGAAFAVSPLFLKSHPEKVVKKLTRKVQAFLSANYNGGRFFVELIEDSFLLSLVMGNDSPGFDDLRQLFDFKRQSTPKTVSVMKEFGETYDSYHI